MSTKKQTAVNFLWNKASNGEHLTPEDFEQAKAMEKEQIINAHLTGLIYPLEIEATKQAEEYYNETFKQDYYDRKRICNI